MTLYVAKPKELVELVVLGLLTERPRHPYDMQRELKRNRTQVERFVRTNRRNIETQANDLVSSVASNLPS